ncbi:MAG: RNA methyltransferase [Deltaproteobacteria bacterium]|nr:RNA methyltransferase [Deltaproteobacteria bacterium]
MPRTRGVQPEWRGLASLCFDLVMHPIWVETLDDPRLTDYRNVRDADLRRRRGLFMAEGRLVVEQLLGDSRFRADSVFMTPRSCEAMRPVLARLPHGAPVYLAKQELFNQVVGFDMHRGCLAAGQIGRERQPLELISAQPADASLLVVLEGLTNTENVGGVFRNAQAFGADGVLLCPRSCDPLYRKAIRVSMGGTLKVPFARFDRWPDSLEQLRCAGYKLIALDLAEDAMALSDITSSIDLGSRVALVLGTEGRGLSEAALGHVDHSVRIPMAPGIDSLNVASASAIALQFLHSRGASAQPDRARASGARSREIP